jgi:hypothetical protein
MKARRVKHLDPAAPLADNLERIVETRLDELCSFMPRAGDPRRIQALHDMRIAAKRLRYILEVGEGLFGPYAKQAGKRTKELQDLLGEIHDCDVTFPRITALAEEARAADLEAILAASGQATAVAPEVLAAAPHHDAHAGLAAMTTSLLARRALLFARFEEMWLQLEREGFSARLRFAVTERPLSHLDNGKLASPLVPSESEQ